MRGWLHGVCVLVWFLSRDQLGLSANADTLASYVVFVYFFSALYHLVPWSHPLSYETAMFLDFVGIQVAYIGHIATWAGWTSWLAMASQFVACIVFAIGPTVLLGKASSANTTGLLQPRSPVEGVVEPKGTEHGVGWVVEDVRYKWGWGTKGTWGMEGSGARTVPGCGGVWDVKGQLLLCLRVPPGLALAVMECGRRRRLYGTLVQQAMLCYAEICYMKHGVFLTLGIVGKFLFPLYFRHYAAYDAKRQGPLVWPGVWSPHENFHASTLIVHILGILGMAHAESLQSPSQ
eukprot:gene14401-biopygen14852